MLTVPPFTPSGPGFVNGTSQIDAAWLNYVSQNFPRALDALGGGYYQGSTDALRLSGDLRKITINAVAAAYPTEMRGYTVFGLSNDGNYATGAGQAEFEIPVLIEKALTLTGDDARFRERNPLVGSATSTTLSLTRDTIFVPAIAGNIVYTLPRSTGTRPAGGECIRIVSRGLSATRTITVQGEGQTGTIGVLDAGFYSVAEFRFNGGVDLGDGFGSWWLASWAGTNFALGSDPCLI